MINDGFNISGEFTITQVRNGVVIARDNLKNSITNQGIHRLFDLWFLGATNSAVVVGLIDANLFAGVAATDTAAVHGGWSQLSGSPPKPLIMTVAANKISSTDTTTSTGTRFDIMSNGFVKGIFIQTSDNLFLWNTAIYLNRLALVVNVGDALYVTYSTKLTIDTDKDNG